MFDRRKIEYTYLKLSKKIKDFLLSDKSREFLIFLFFFFIFLIRITSPTTIITIATNINAIKVTT